MLSAPSLALPAIGDEDITGGSEGEAGTVVGAGGSPLFCVSDDPCGAGEGDQ